MTCEIAMITKVISITPDKTVADVMDLFEKHSIRGVPVVDENGVLAGLFTLTHLLRGLLPQAVLMEDQPRLKHMDVSLDNIHGTMEGVLKKLEIFKANKIADVMIEPDVVHPDMPLREGIRLLEKYGSPIPVIENDETRKVVGVITSQSIIKTLKEAKIK